IGGVMSVAERSPLENLMSRSLRPSGRCLSVIMLATVISVLAWTNPAAQADTPGDLYFTTTPCRLLDTRSGPPLSRGWTTVITAAGNCEVPLGASEVVLNITAIIPTAAGSLTAYSGAAIPPDPTLPFKAGVTRANNAIVMLDSLGKFNLLATLGGGKV